MTEDAGSATRMQQPRRFMLHAAMGEHMQLLGRLLQEASCGDPEGDHQLCSTVMRSTAALSMRPSVALPSRRGSLVRRQSADDLENQPAERIKQHSPDDQAAYNSSCSTLPAQAAPRLVPPAAGDQPQQLQLQPAPPPSASSTTLASPVRTSVAYRPQSREISDGGLPDLAPAASVNTGSNSVVTGNTCADAAYPNSASVADITSRRMSFNGAASVPSGSNSTSQTATEDSRTGHPNNIEAVLSMASRSPQGIDNGRTQSTRPSNELLRRLTSPQAQAFWAVLIMVNTASMIAEEEYSGSRLGYEIGRYTRYGSEEYHEQWWPGAEDMFSMMEWIFAGLFTVEVGINMLCHGRRFFKDPWNLMDLLVVFCSDLVLLGAFVKVPFKVTLFRLLRLARLGRLVKLLRQMEGFDSLHLMTTALRGSVGALWWSFLLIFLMQTFFSLSLTFLMRYLYLEDDSSYNMRPETKEELFSYFGTYFRSMFTLFELTLANYPTISRFLIEELSELWLIPCIAYKFIMGVAVLGVLNGVFIQETFNVAKTDDASMVRTKMRQANLHRDKMTKLFKYADRQGAGQIGIKEFRSVMKHKSIQVWLASMDLDCTDADQLFHLISKGEYITVEELIHGIFRLKGSARSIDVKVVLQLLRSLRVSAQDRTAYASPTATAASSVGPVPPTMVTPAIPPLRLLSEVPKSEAQEVAAAGELPIPAEEADHRGCGGSFA